MRLDPFGNQHSMKPPTCKKQGNSQADGGGQAFHMGKSGIDWVRLGVRKWLCGSVGNTPIILES